MMRQLPTRPRGRAASFDAMIPSKNECHGVQDGPVWIPSDAITREFPKN